MRFFVLRAAPVHALAKAIAATQATSLMATNIANNWVAFAVAQVLARLQPM